MLIRGTFQLAQAGANAQSLQNSFNRLSAGIGENGEELLKALREASAGTISNTELILGANTAMVLGVARSQDELVKLLEISRLASRELGISVQFAFDSVVKGIGRASPFILDNIGIIADAESAQRKYAESLGITTSELTKEQRAEALKFSVLEVSARRVAEAGELSLNYSDRLQQVTASLSNLRDNIGRALLPAMVSLIDATDDGTSGFLQTREQINELGLAFYKVGQVIVGFGHLVASTWNQATAATALLISSLVRIPELALKGVRALEYIRNPKTIITGSPFDGLIESLEGISLGGGLAEDATRRLEKAQISAIKSIEAFGQLLDPSGYVGLNAEQFANVLAGNNDESVAGALAKAEAEAEEARKATEGFQQQLLGTVDTARQAQQALGKDLSNAFNTFGDSLEQNVRETTEGLARIVAGAEDFDTSRITEFQEREAQRVEALRARLEEAGIDASRAGLDNLLEVRDLEAEVQEQRRLADLDEFARFEEQQVAKREALVTAFIEEVNLINEKIETQRQLEQETTDFLLEQNNLREESYVKFADSAIAKFGEMAKALRQVETVQQRINRLQTGRNITTPNTSSGGVTNDNSRQVNATINVTANVDEDIDVNQIGRELAQQLRNIN